MHDDDDDVDEDENEDQDDNDDRDENDSLTSRDLTLVHTTLEERLSGAEIRDNFTLIEASRLDLMSLDVALSKLERPQIGTATLWRMWESLAVDLRLSKSRESFELRRFASSDRHESAGAFLLQIAGGRPSKLATRRWFQRGYLTEDGKLTGRAILRISEIAFLPEAQAFLNTLPPLVIPPPPPPDEEEEESEKGES